VTPEHLDHPLPDVGGEGFLIACFELTVLTDRDADEPRGTALAQAEVSPISAHHRGIGGEHAGDATAPERRCSSRGMLGRRYCRYAASLQGTSTLPKIF